MDPNIDITTQFYLFLAGVVVPLLTGLVTKARTTSAVKGVTNTLLSVLGAVLIVAAEHGLHLDAHLGISAFMVFISSTTSYKTLWKPTGVAAAIQNATRGFGIGSESLESPPVPPTAPHSTRHVGPS